MENELSMSVYNEDYLIALEYTMPHIYFFTLYKKKTTEMMLNLNMCYGNMSSGVYKFCNVMTTYT